jgi:hypothetical protein
MNNLAPGVILPPAPAPKRKSRTLIGILLAVALAGLSLGLVRGVWQANAPFPPLPETERPKRLDQMRAAVDAFYQNPTDATHQAARDAVINYRRTFADALPDTLQAGSEKIDCGQSAECEMLRERKNKEHIALAGVIINKYHSLSMAGLEYHAKVAIDFALERRITGTVPIAWIDEDRKHFNGEKELAALRERFFADIDKAVRNGGPAVRDLLDYLKIYAKAAEKTFKPIKAGRDCPHIQSDTEDGRQCSRSTREVGEAHRLPDRAARAAAAKKAITERDAPIEVLQQAITQLWR